MPAGDAGLEQQTLSEQVQERLLTAVADTAREFLDRVTAPDHVWDHQRDGACLDQLVAALDALDQAQAAQPEGERR